MLNQQPLAAQAIFLAAHQTAYCTFLMGLNELYQEKSLLHSSQF